MGQNNTIHIFAVRMPEPVSSPRIESSVVTRFQHRIEYLVESDFMTTPATVANVYSCSWRIVNSVVARHYSGRHGNLYTGSLLFHLTQIVEKIVSNHTLLRIIVVQRTRNFIDLIIR